MGNKKLNDFTIKELAEAIAKELSEREKPITTIELSHKLLIENSTISYYKKLGMPNNGYNSWYYSECIDWLNNIYPTLLKRKKKSKAKTK